MRSAGASPVTVKASAAFVPPYSMVAGVVAVSVTGARLTVIVKFLLDLALFASVAVAVRL